MELENESNSNSQQTLNLLKENDKLSTILRSAKRFEIIDSDYDKCLITLLGEIESSLDNPTEKFILRIKKKEFEILNLKDSAEQEKFKKLLGTLITNIFNSSNVVFNNDIYYKLIAQTDSDNGLKIDFIYPADKKVIDKYKQKKYVFFTESYATYTNKTKKYIDSIDPSHTKWIENALYKNTEPILFQIPNQFIILKDYHTVDNKNILNCLGLPFEKIKCLRDLDATHIPLLEKFYNEGRQNLAKIFKTEVDKIRVFVHYQPTFYYFHVHYLSIELESSSIQINRAHDLFGVIQNLKFDSDYYKKIDIKYVLVEGGLLYNYLYDKDKNN